MPISNVFGEYAELDAQIKALEAKKEQLRPHMVSMMIERGEDKVVNEFGTFSVNQLKKWSYPAEIVELGEEFKAAQAKAQSTGEATYEETPSLRFTPAKL